MKYLFINLLLLGVIYSQYTPKNLYYFSSDDVVFSTNPILNVINIQTGVKTYSQPMKNYPGGTVLAAFNNGDSEDELIIFGYKRLDKSTWELTLSMLDVNNFTETQFGSIQLPTPLSALWDPSPSFGYDPNLKSVFGLNLVEYEMNITKYDFANSVYDILYIPPQSQEPYNFQPSGAYNPSNNTYYINFYNQNSMLEIMEYNVETGEAQFGHEYARYPNYPITSLLYTNNVLYGLYNPGNTQTLVVSVDPNSNTLKQVFSVIDNDEQGTASIAANQNYMVFVTHQNAKNTLITCLDLTTMKSTSKSTPTKNFPNYPLVVPVTAFI